MKVTKPVSLGIIINVGEDRALADEVYSLLGSIGFKKYGIHYPNKRTPWLFINNYSDIMNCTFKADNDIEVTLEQLKDIVVLKRNDVNDANTYTDKKCVESKLYLTSGKELYFFNTKTSLWENGNILNHEMMYLELKPIEKTMKEYLDKDYVLRHVKQTTGDNRVPEGWVEVPEGAEVYAYWHLDNTSIFHKSENQLFEDDSWTDVCSWRIEQILNGESGAKVLWQRNTQELEVKNQETGKVTIDGVEAFNAIANDIQVQYRFAGSKWKDYTQDLNHDSSKLKAVTFLCGHCEFRYKPKTIIVNGVEYEDEQEVINVVKDYFK